MTELTFQSLPPVLPAFGKLATSRGRKGALLDAPVRATASAVSVSGRDVRAYARVCGADASEHLPICYPQVLALPLQLRLMGLDEFPLPGMGLVHIGNIIEQHRDLSISEAFDLRVSIDSIEATERGREFDMVTEALSGGEVIWRGVAHILNRSGGGGGKSGKRPAAEPSPLPRMDEWKLNANLGRRYARVSGDFNPIHLFAVSAKLLGFKRAIAHGMWTLARSAARLGAAGSCRLEAQFKTPVFLPARISLHAEVGEAETRFDVRDARNHKPHLAGRIAPLG